MRPSSTGLSSTPRMQDLFAAAREDAPPSLVRDEVWGRVAAATVIPTGAAAVAKVVTPASGKLVAVGAVIGAATAAVVTALALIVLPTDTTGSAPLVRRAPSAPVSGTAHGARLAEPAPRPRATTHTTPSAHTIPSAPVRIEAPTTSQDDASALAEEARLITEARAALVRGEPEHALASVRNTHRLSVRALEPEELALEGRALRALGRTDEALATELNLRRRFPSHSLSR
jgi:hypothetical protein